MHTLTYKNERIRYQFFFISALFIITEIQSFGSPKPPSSINLINWAGYFAGGLDKDLQSRFPELSLTEYKSNEEALVKLTKNEQPFHLAILSTVLTPIIYQNNQIKNASGKFQKSRYVNFLQQSSINYCLPFQWGVTVYLDRSHQNKDFSLKDILISGDRTRHYVQDDMIEIVSMLYSEFLTSKKYQKPVAHLSDLNNPKVFSEFETFLNSIKAHQSPKSLFTTPIQAHIETIYGAIGFLEPMASKNKNFRFAIPQKPVAGADYLCLLNNKHSLSLADQQKIDQIFSYLSSEDFLKSVSMKRKYFTPFKQDQKHQHELESAAINMISHSGYVEPDPISPDVHKKLNLWWQKFRFGYERS